MAYVEKKTNGKKTNTKAKKVKKEKKEKEHLLVRADNWLHKPAKEKAKDIVKVGGIVLGGAAVVGGTVAVIANAVSGGSDAGMDQTAMGGALPEANAPLAAPVEPVVTNETIV